MAAVSRPPLNLLAAAAYAVRTVLELAALVRLAQKREISGGEMSRIPKDGEYFAMKTLLGCAPGEDRNRRSVYRWPEAEPVLTMNDRMRHWTDLDELRLEIILEALNRGDK